MKTTYSSVTLRYIHDVVTGEFVTVGVVVYAPGHRYLGARLNPAYSRLNAMFGKVDHLNFGRLVRHMQKRFAAIAEEIKQDFTVADAWEILDVTHRVLPADDSSLQWSAPTNGFTADPAAVLDRLYERHVLLYCRTDESKSRSDEDIVRPFKARLRDAASRLEKKIIHAPDYQYEFENAWKNGSWHIYQPVSFDLMTAEGIKEKAIHWLGRGTPLRNASEKFTVHFLLGEPRDAKNTSAFRDARHLMQQIPFDKELIEEKDLESFADQVADEIAAHPA